MSALDIPFGRQCTAYERFSMKSLIVDEMSGRLFIRGRIFIRAVLRAACRRRPTLRCCHLLLPLRHAAQRLDRPSDRPARLIARADCLRRLQCLLVHSYGKREVNIGLAFIWRVCGGDLGARVLPLLLDPAIATLKK